MKQIIFLICCILSNVHLFAQNNFSKELFPVLAELQITECSGYYEDYEEKGVVYKSYLTAPQKEIIINSKKYLRWGMYLLREENRKILVYSEILNKDFVLYDFTLDVGDTLTTLNLDWYCEPKSVVDYPVCVDPREPNVTTFHIDTLVVTEVSKMILLDGNEYKKWKFSNGWSYVEMIGMLGDFFGLITYTGGVIGSYMGTRIVCVSNNGQLLYQMSESEIENLWSECKCLNEGVPTDIETITAPTVEFQKIIHKGQLYIIREGKTYNTMGVEVKDIDF